MFGRQYMCVSRVSGKDVAEFSLTVSQPDVDTVLRVFYYVGQVILIAGTIHPHQAQGTGGECRPVCPNHGLFCHHLTIGVPVHFSEIGGVGQGFIS